MAQALASYKKRQKNTIEKKPQAMCEKSIMETGWESLLKNIRLKANSTGYPLGIRALWWELAELSIIHNRLVLVCGKI